MRLRRSELSTPGSNERMIEKAAASAADLVFLDLEDSVAPSQKAAARTRVAEALRALDWGKKTRAVRINAIDTPYAHEDVIEVVEKAGEELDLVIVPKVRAARDVWWVDVLLGQLEAKHRRRRPIALEVLIEEVQAMVDVAAIARSSPRLEALIFGPGDYSASQGIRIDEIDKYPGDVWHHARNQIVIAARAGGIEAVDGPYADLRKPDAYRTECLRARILGMTGKWAIHPSQIEIANEMFSPTAEEVERARRTCDAYAEAEAAGVGAIAFEGRLIDAASVRILRSVVERAALIAAR